MQCWKVKIQDSCIKNILQFEKRKNTPQKRYEKNKTHGVKVRKIKKLGLRALEANEVKTAVEKMRLLQQLEDEDRQTIFKLINKMLTNKKFKDFFSKNVASL